MPRTPRFYHILPALLLPFVVVAADTTTAVPPVASVHAQNAPEVRSVVIPSEAMKRGMSATVVLPPLYDLYPDSRYPVVYLLHGAGGNCNHWVDAQYGDAARLAAKYQVILVCPTGGMGWYFDTAHAGAYETHVAREVVAWADANLRTRPGRDARAIAGLSMGGHGAIWLGSRHPETFGAIGCMSGGVDVRDWAPKNSWDLGKLLGADPKVWEAHSDVVQAPRLFAKSKPLLLVDCGTEDFFLKNNRDLHQALLAAKVPHIYTERPGAHEWPVWREALKSQMSAFAEMFAKNKAAE